MNNLQITSWQAEEWIVPITRQRLGLRQSSAAFGWPTREKAPEDWRTPRSRGTPNVPKTWTDALRRFEHTGYGILGVALALIFSGCAVGPDYKRPTSAAPAQYKAEALGSWKEGRPLDHVPKGEW